METAATIKLVADLTTTSDFVAVTSWYHANEMLVSSFHTVTRKNWSPDKESRLPRKL